LPEPRYGAMSPSRSDEFVAREIVHEGLLVGGLLCGIDLAMFVLPWRAATLQFSTEIPSAASKSITLVSFTLLGQS
jgi:hypothetical protein